MNPLLIDFHQYLKLEELYHNLIFCLSKSISKMAFKCSYIYKNKLEFRTIVQAQKPSAESLASIMLSQEF